MKVASRDLQILFDVGVVGTLSDRELLERFAANRDNAAFEALVRRHGPMVWGVCRRVLRNRHDAEDAFQATFLIFARKAASIAHRDLVGNWLYAVAFRTARKARAMTSKRQARESQVTDQPEPATGSVEWQDDLLSLLDQELIRLPEKYRIPIVLCDLQGKTHKDVASQLGVPIGTVSSRLSRARDLLARRLSRLGMALTVGSLAALLAQEAASASMPTRLIGSTAQAASLYAAGGAATAGAVPAGVAALTREVLKMMLLSKIKLGTAMLLVVSALTAGGTGLAYQTQAEGPNQEKRTQAPGATRQDGPRPGGLAKEDPKKPSDMEQIQGVWRVERLEQVNHQPTEDEKEFWRSGGYTITIQGNKIKHNIDQSFGFFTLDPSQAPKIMTLEAAEGPNKGQHVPAIYRLDGDDLMICQGRKGDMEPPQAFSVEKRRPGTFPTLFVLKRKLTITDAAQKVKDLEERVNTLRAQLGEAEMELKRAQGEVSVSKDQPVK